MAAGDRGAPQPPDPDARCWSRRSPPPGSPSRPGASGARGGRPRDRARTDLDELAALADSAGAEPVARIVQSRAEPDPATYIGKGKIEELHDVIHTLKAPTP